MVFIFLNIKYIYPFIYILFSFENRCMEILLIYILLLLLVGLVYFLSRRAKRRAENPLRGLLELPSRRVRRNSSSWFGWLGDGLMSMLRRSRVA